MARVLQLFSVLFYLVLCFESVGHVCATDSQALSDPEPNPRPMLPAINIGHIQGLVRGFGNLKKYLETSRNARTSWLEKTDNSVRQRCFNKPGRWGTEKGECGIWKETNTAGHRNGNNSLHSDVINHGEKTNTYHKQDWKAPKLPKLRLRKRKKIGRRWKKAKKNPKAYKKKRKIYH